MTETKYALLGDVAAMLSRASVEVSSRVHQLAELRDHFSPGIDVTITFLPGDDYRHNVETAAALRRMGFNPVLHVAAREMRSRDALDDFLARARGEAEANRILIVAGDSCAPWAHSNPARTSARAARSRRKASAPLVSLDIRRAIRSLAPRRR